MFSKLTSFLKAFWNFLAHTIHFRFAGIAWGDVSTRERMVVNSQEIYKRLLLRSPDPNLLQFDTLALASAGQNGTLAEDKLKDLIRLFRPDRDGKQISRPRSFL